MMRKCAAALIGFAVAMTACAGEAPITGERRNVGAVTASFRVEPTSVRVGEAVQMRIRLVNNSGEAQTLRFPSGQHYDFWVLADDGTEIWRWSDGRVFTQAIEEEELGGQAGLSFSEAWTPEAVGEYVVRAELMAEGYEGPFEGQVRVE